MFYYTYILKSKKDGRMYTGYTSDLRNTTLENLHIRKDEAHLRLFITKHVY